MTCNHAHPAYIRAAASRSGGYHIAPSVALALAPLAVEPNGAHAAVLQIPILPRDVARFRAYFPTVRLVSPD
ncbi:MAG: hypothetical protein K2Y16_08130 [Burkholderiales bacterium]|nr:hypothetical protein [Burkholderiales bacterium]